MNGTQDLTKGKVSTVVLKFYFPMLFTNLLQQIYSFVDSVIVGKGLGDNAFALVVGNICSAYSNWCRWFKANFDFAADAERDYER